MDMVDYGLLFVGRPYIWAGNCLVEGADCSGFVSELLKAVGHIPGYADYSSQMMYERLEGKQSLMFAKRNAILLFGKSIDRITHVAVAIDDKLMLEAGGGNITTIDRDAAIRDNAMVRIRPINNRKDLLGVFEL